MKGTSSTSDMYLLTYLVGDTGACTAGNTVLYWMIVHLFSMDILLTVPLFILHLSLLSFIFYFFCYLLFYIFIYFFLLTSQYILWVWCSALRSRMYGRSLHEWFRHLLLVTMTSTTSTVTSATSAITTSSSTTSTSPSSN